MADKTYALDSGTTKGKFVDIGNSLFAKADVPLVKTASGLYLPFPITNAGYYPAVLQAGSDVVGKVGIDQTVPGTTNGVQVNSSVLPTGASTEATLALIKAKTDNIPSDPSKESGKLTALETLITTLNGKIDTLDAVIDSIKDTDGIKKITDTVDVQLSGSNVEDITFHDAAVAAANGTVFTVAGYKTLTVEIYGSSTSRTVAFIGRGPSGEDRYIAGVKLSDLSVATGSTGTGELWQFDVTGLVSVLMDLTDVDGGNVTVKGRAVA